MSPERVGPSRVKTEVYVTLRSVLATAKSGCEVFGDGMTVRIDDTTVCGPDASARGGPRLSIDEVLFDDSAIVVEVVSPSRKSIDAGRQTRDFFRPASVRPYLVVHSEGPRVIHQRRDAAGEIITRVVVEGEPIALDPPGIEFSVADVFSTL